jgi:pyridoxal phosphate enzyme (YggS family)
MGSIRLTEIRERIAAAADRAGREADEVRLVVVTKSATPEQLSEAYLEGHRDFGENRAAELVAASAGVPDDARWHFIGRLQGNKVPRIRGITSLLHSLDRPALIRYWLKGPGSPPPVLVQVNVGGEPQKGGVAPEEAPALVAEAVALGLDVRGLMAIPPQGERPEDSRPWFRALTGTADAMRGEFPGLTELSMGMTDDFEVAVAEGATILRVGRAIFGPFEGGS